MKQSRTSSNLAKRIALDFLAADGIAAIWKLHLVAVVLHNAGYHSVARILIDAADRAEEIWQQQAAEFGEKWARERNSRHDAR